jgi:hypothetical protein
MQPEPEWSIIFYVDERGHEPVRKFLKRLDLKTQARFAWSIEQLRTRNVQFIPYARFSQPARR